MRGKKVALTPNFFQQVKWPESYTSLILGVIVVMITAFLLISFIKSKNSGQISFDKTENMSQDQEQKNNKGSFTYVATEGDTLWSISEKYYKSGYNWVEIAKANNLANPDLLEKGTKLVLPKLETKIVKAKNSSIPNEENSQIIESNSIIGSSYTIQKGDDLWDIAVRAYGDGFAWVRIAKANNLANPDIIHSGNDLIIPR